VKIDQTTVPARTGPHDGLAFIRAAACVMVIAVHSVECFYISMTGELVKAHGLAVGLLGSAFRACVPLFVMVTGALLLPARGSAATFLARRLRRVVVPLVVWSVAYTVALFLKGAYDGATCLELVAMIPVQFNPYVGHLWYVYMLVGLYLLIPILSPWLERASNHEVLGVLALWGVTLLLPYARRWQPHLLGEAHWNATSTLYYFNGYVGYLLLGHFLAHRRAPFSRFSRPSISVALFLVGYATTVGGFLATLPGATTVPGLELFWQFDTINVAVMAAGLFTLGFAVRGRGRPWFGAVARFASASYAVYLAHIFVLSALFTRWGQGRSPWLAVPLLAALTATLTYTLVALLARLPKAAVWIGVAASGTTIANTASHVQHRRDEND